MTRAVTIALVVALAALCSLASRADALGRFDIKPISITLAPGEAAATVEITNDGALPQELEMNLTAWTQTDTGDDGAATDDIVVSPSIFTIAPGKTQIVRLGPTRALQGDVERTYRLIATEVPLGPDGANVHALLRMRLPIFVPPHAIDAAPLTWSAVRSDAEHLTVSAHNDGNVHRRIRSLRVEAAGRAVFDNVVAAYVLEHQTRRWTIPLRAGDRAGSIRVVGTEMDGTTHEATFAVR